MLGKIAGKHSKMMTRTIIEFRIEAKMTQKQMAQKLKISRQKYNKMENGKMSVEDFERIADILELRVQIIPKRYVK
jgi:DNA-binding XRE family transcriptional regulator